MSIKQITKLRYKTKDKPPIEGVPLLGYNKKYSCPWEVMYKRGDKYYTCMKLLTSNIRHSYGEINFERHPRPVEVEGEDKH